MGLFPTEETEDILLDTYTHEITDEEPDLMRRRASVHAGAAYLESDTYPPGGVSSGQSGGFMDAEDEVTGVERTRKRYGRFSHRYGQRLKHFLQNLLPGGSSVPAYGDKGAEGKGATDDKGGLSPAWGGKGSYDSKSGVDSKSGTDTAAARAGDTDAATPLISGHGYMRGVDVLGAVPTSTTVRKVSPTASLTKKIEVAKSNVGPRAGFVVKKTPTGRKFTSMVTTKSKHGDHATSIKNAKDVAKRAAAVGAKLLKALAKKPVVKVHGDDEVWGARAPKGTHRKLSPAEMKKVATDTIKAAGKLVGQATKHGEFVVASTKAQTAALAKTKEKMKARLGGTSVHGYEDDSDAAYKMLHINHAESIHSADMLGAYCDVLGDDLPDATCPGYLISGDADPNAPTTDTAPPADTAPTDDTGTGAGVAGPPDYGVGPAPTVAPALSAEAGDFQPSTAVPGNDLLVYSSSQTPVPKGAVYYDAAVRDAPFKAIASYTTFHGRLPSGVRPDGGEEGGVGAGFEWHGDQGSKWWVYWPDSSSSLNPPSSTEASSLSAMEDASIKHNWGPLVGNPAMDEWAGLRLDKDKGQFFWYYDQAPSWAKLAGPNGEVARLNQALVDWQTAVTAAKTDYTNQQLQDALDAKTAADLAKSQALEDAAHQRQIDKDQKDAEAQAAVQAVKDDTANKQAQAQADIEASKAKSQSETETTQWQAQAQTQAEIDAKAMEAQAAIDERAAEMAARLDAAQDERDLAMAQKLDALRAPGGGGEEEGGEEGEEVSPEEADDASYVLEDTGESVTGTLRGVTGFKARRAARY